jgi:hypothetical protein
MATAPPVALGFRKGRMSGNISAKIMVNAKKTPA